MTGAGVPSSVVVLVLVVALVAALAWPVMAFIAIRALTRIANELQKLNSQNKI